MEQNEKQKYDDAWAAFYAKREQLKSEGKTWKSYSEEKKEQKPQQKQKTTWPIVILILFCGVFTFIAFEYFSDSSSHKNTYTSAYIGTWLSRDNSYLIEVINDTELRVDTSSSESVITEYAENSNGIIYRHDGMIWNLAPDGQLYMLEDCHPYERFAKIGKLYRYRK